MKLTGLALIPLSVLCCVASAQENASDSASRAAAIEHGANIAKGGFRNEDEIRDKFNDWKNDSDTRQWLEAMKYRFSDIEDVSAVKPHGEKSDVEVRIRTKFEESVERISIKLVSNPRGFNQIDKRWLATYAGMWNMPAEVQNSLKLFVGETPPREFGRNSERMFLDELEPGNRMALVNFFTEHKGEVLSDLLAGDGEHAADWIMVTLKTTDPTKWGLWSMDEAIRFYGDGDVVVTRAGSLKIGRITMQRKGGDNGRATAKMLQFKMNPAELFELAKPEPDIPSAPDPAD